MRIYSVKATSSIHLRVEYRCSYCNSVNCDDGQYLVANAESHGSVISTPGQTTEANQKAADKLEAQIRDIGQGNLQSAHLKCVCSSCGKRQLWASYMKYPIWTIVVCIIGVMLGFSLLSRWGEFEFLPQQLLVPLMPIPLIVIFVHNLLIKSKVSRLDPMYMPKISPFTNQKLGKQN